MITKASINKAIDKHGVLSGAACHFVQISATKGVKLYHQRSVRDFAMREQAKAHKFKLAPKVYNKVAYRGACPLDYCDVECDNPVGDDDWSDKTLYGYVTQVAKVKPAWGPKFDLDLGKLHANMKRNGWATNDVYGTNVGYIGKRMVCIDFDGWTMS